MSPKWRKKWKFPVQVNLSRLLPFQEKIHVKFVIMRLKNSSLCNFVFRCTMAGIQNIIKKQFLIYIYNQKIVKIFFFCFEYVNVL